MKTVSASFLDQINKSHRLTTQVQVFTPTGSEFIDILDGTVTLDATADSRGRVELTVPADLAPASPSDLLAPYGNETKVYAGVPSEVVPLGVFRIESAEINDTGDNLTVAISGVDRSIRVIEAVFEDAFTQDAGVLIPDAIEAIIEEVFPEVQTSFATTSLTTPVLVAEEGSDRWDFCQGLVEAMGCSLYFDGDGILVLAPNPTGLSPAVATFTEGVDATLLSASRSWTRDDAVNRVVVTGENTDDTGDVPRGVATNDVSSSPTRYGGPFGRVTFSYSSEYVTSDAQAADVAQTILQQKLGTSERVSFDSLNNPAIEPYDVVRIQRERADLDNTFILDSVTIPLNGGSMSAATRATRVEVG